MEGSEMKDDAAATITPPIDIDTLLKNNETKDCYDDDVNELKFLVSKPTCFVVLGKPGSGKTSVASKIAQHWHCELVSPAEVILQNMEMETEIGVKAKDMLYRGEAVPEEMVAKMIEDKINSAEVAHHGYVLDGLPSMCTDYMSIKDQLELIKSFKLQPDFLVHIKLSDIDLETRRVGQRVDPLTADIYTMEIYNPDKPEPKPKPEGEEEEEEEEAEEEHEEEEEHEVTTLPPETVGRLLIRPEDLPERAQASVADYRSSVLKLSEDFMADHNSQYLLELDGNLPLATLELHVLAKLSTFNIRPAAVPIRLADLGEEEEGVSDDLDTDELMRTLAPKNMVAPRFRWRRSRWLRYCPVALQEGLLVSGKAEFACGFLDKVYLMSSPEAYAKFLKNPRPFLMPPQPRPPAKFAVMGPPKSGSSTLAKFLADRYGAKIIDVDSRLAPKIAEEKAKYVEQIRAEAQESAIETVKKKLKEAQEAAIEAARLEAERLEAEKIERLAREAAEREAAAAEAAANGEGNEGGEAGAEDQTDQPPKSPAPEAAEDAEGAEDGEGTEGPKPVDGELSGDEQADAEGGKKDEEDTSKPSEADDTPKPTSPTPPPEIDVGSDHPQVKAIVDAAIKVAEAHVINLSAEVVIDTLEEAIKQLEEDNALVQPTGPLHGGWILDNFPKTREQWGLMLEKSLMPDDVIVLKDNSDGGNLLLKRWYALNKESVDLEISARLEKENEIKKQREEEQSNMFDEDEDERSSFGRMEEEDRKRAEEEEHRRKVDERARRVEAGEDPVELDRELFGIIPESEVNQAAEDSAMEGVTPLGPSDAEATDPATAASEPPVDTDSAAEQITETGGESEAEPTPAGDAEGAEAGDSSAAEASPPEDAADDESQSAVEGTATEDEAERSKSGMADETTPNEASGAEQSVDPSPQSAEVGQAPAAPSDLPPDGPELEAAREKRKEWDREFPSIDSVISSAGNLEPISIEIEDVDASHLIQQAVEKIEKRFEYAGWEYTGMDLDEEEEDNAAEAEGNEEEAEEEEEEDLEAKLNKDEITSKKEEADPNRNKKKPLGDFNHFCPVAFTEKGVLWPGNPECSAKYCEKVYYLSNDDNRTKFLETPTKYLQKEYPPKPPAARLLCLGAKGAGKSLHARAMAKKHGIFHIQFEEKLQELLMRKAKKKIGPLYEAEEEFKDAPEDLDEDKELEEFEKTFTMADLDDVTEEEGSEDRDNEEAEGDYKDTEKEEIADTVPELLSQKGVHWRSAEPGPTPAVSAAPAPHEPHDADNDPEAEEEAEPEYSEEEEAVKSYLEGGMEDMMPPEVLENIIGEFWDKEPFKSTGFILEGFPRTADEVRWMAESGYFPDTAVIIQSEDSDIIGRLLPPKMELWKAKRERKLNRRQRQKDRARKIREKEIEKRRRELAKEREKKAEEKRLEKEAAKAEMSDEEAEEEAEEEEEEEEEDIEALLAEEFEAEEEEEEDEDETEEDARDRLSNDLAELYDNDTNRLSAVSETLDETLIPHIELEGGKKPHIIRYQLNKSMKPYIDHRASMFERCYTINERLAERMIAVGYKQPSRFGRWCPVQLLDGGCVQPNHGPNAPTYPVVYRGCIYFLSTPQNRELFCQHPLKYLEQPSPKPVVPIRMAIIGPPKSGKSTLARRFEKEYGAQRISLGDAIRKVLTTQPKTKLAKSIQEVLRCGGTVSDSLAVAALHVALMDMSCSTRGYILDGFPVTMAQVELMTKVPIIPVRVVELQCSNMEIMVRATKDRLDPERGYPRHDSAQIVMVKMNTFTQNRDQIKNWYTSQHMNYEVLSAERSKWWVWNEALQIAFESVKTIQGYLESVSEGKASRVHALCITPGEFKARLGEFSHFCPVSLYDGELVDCSVTESLEHSVEFRGRYYKCAGEAEMEKFLSNPEKYVPPLAPRRLPSEDQLPQRISVSQAKGMFPKPLELKGYCPVTFLDGKLRYEAIVSGDMEIGCVLFRGKLYSFESEDKLLKFLRLPEKYWSLKLPHKLPPKKEPVSVTGLPMLGFMEQTVAHAVTKALTRCGCFKPKYPFLTTTQSALIYIAYHLKAFNPRNSEYVRKKYKRKLEKFEESCSLISYLGDNMTLRYKEPELRPIDFNHKLKLFLEMRDHKTSTTA